MTFQISRWKAINETFLFVTWRGPEAEGTDGRWISISSPSLCWTTWLPDFSTLRLCSRWEQPRAKGRRKAKFVFGTPSSVLPCEANRELANPFKNREYIHTVENAKRPKGFTALSLLLTFLLQAPAPPNWRQPTLAEFFMHHSNHILGLSKQTREYTFKKKSAQNAHSSTLHAYHGTFSLANCIIPVY